MNGTGLRCCYVSCRSCCCFAKAFIYINTIKPIHPHPASEYYYFGSNSNIRVLFWQQFTPLWFHFIMFLHFYLFPSHLSLFYLLSHLYWSHFYHFPCQSCFHWNGVPAWKSSLWQSGCASPEMSSKMIFTRLLCQPLCLFLSLLLFWPFQLSAYSYIPFERECPIAALEVDKTFLLP